MKISYSLPTNLRAKCKFCATGPEQYFYVGNRRINKSLPIKKIKINLVSDLYSNSQSSPRYFKSITPFSLHIDNQYKAGTRYFRNHKDKYVGENLTNALVMLALTCECRKTMWLISREVRHNKSFKFLDENIRYLR